MPKLLILGGTNFIGRNLVDSLLKDEAWDITLFNRQQSGPNLFPDIKKIKGDRNTSDIEEIGREAWDYVIDLSCYFPAQLEASLKALPSVKRYILISTCSVYDNQAHSGMLRDEQAPLLACSEQDARDPSTATYGQRKAECERLLAKSGKNYSILRPALVFGPYDPTDRFYYWLHQLRKKEWLLLPENGEGVFSLTYVSDLVACILACLHSRGSFEVHNVITKTKISIREILALALDPGQLFPKTLSASADFLDHEGIRPWIDFPLWLKGNFFTYCNASMRHKLGVSPSKMELALKATQEYYSNKEWPEPIYGLKESVRQTLLRKIQKDHA